MASQLNKTKEDKINSFDPNGMAMSSELFGLPFDQGESPVLVFPVPWEVTVSYEAGTASGPSAIRKASWQVDLFDPYISDAWKMGIYMLEPSSKLWNKSDKFREKAEKYLDLLAEDENHPKLESERQKINAACSEMIDWVEKKTASLLSEGKRIVLLGGDHSTPLGYLKALDKLESKPFGVLQIDAHADLRKAYEGFTYSHASIMYNALEETSISHLVQVGIRDYCEEELNYIKAHPDRITTFFDRDLAHQRYRGTTWDQQVNEIVKACPDRVYLSFDIDGLKPEYCPNTGTPVAGGLEPEEVLYLVEKLLESGRTLVGMDLNEVAPGENEWDANVAARMLFRLCNLLGKSNGFL